MLNRGSFANNISRSRTNVAPLPPPNGKWSDLQILEPVRDFKARHASTLLVFDAVEDAIAQIEGKSTAESDVS